MKSHERPNELNPREASHRLGVPVRSLYQLIDEGKLPAYHSGPDILLRPVDVDAYRARAFGSGDIRPS